MKLFQNYCYSTINDVVNAIKSDPFIKDGQTIVNVTATTNDITLTFSTWPTTMVFTPPNCTTIGQLNSYTGLSMADAHELGWLMALAMISTWGIKILRRTL
jgi:hypothetical protein